jgi:hypothetical protein
MGSLKMILILTSWLAFLSVDAHAETTRQARCVVTQARGMVALYSPPRLSTISVDLEQLPSLWSFDDNHGVGAYFELPGPLVLGESKRQEDGLHTSYTADGTRGRFEVDVYVPADVYPIVLPIEIWIEAKTTTYGRGHLLLECLP